MRFWGLRIAVFKGLDQFIGIQVSGKRKKIWDDQRIVGGDRDSLRFPFLKGLACFFNSVWFWENIPFWEA
jgi:hypothetical protein